MVLFKPEHVMPIIFGQKTDSRRNWLEPKKTRQFPNQLCSFSRVKPGRKYKAKTQMISTNYFAELPITKVWQEPLKMIDDTGAKLEGYPNREAYIQAYFKINKIKKQDQEAALENPVWAFRWDYNQMKINLKFFQISAIQMQGGKQNPALLLMDPYKKTAIQPLENKPPLVRMGGKRYLSKIVVPRINTYDYSLYIEPFFGGGRFYFEKEPHYAEIVNDFEARLANFFFCCRHWPADMQFKQQFLVKDENTWKELFDYHKLHYTEICEELRTIRMKWYGAKKAKKKELQDRMLDYAIDFYFLSNMAFRGSLTARSMTYFENDPRTENNRMRWRIFRPLMWVGERMRRTMILNQDFAKIFQIGLKSTNHTRLWVLDPPYWGVEGYETEFPWDRYEELSDLLRNLPQTDYFMLFLNDVPEIRKLFSWCRVEEVSTHYTTGGAGQKKDVIELIFTPQYEPKKKLPKTLDEKAPQTIFLDHFVSKGVKKRK